jgi:hypothetical protein
MQDMNDLPDDVMREIREHIAAACIEWELWMRDREEQRLRRTYSTDRRHRTLAMSISSDRQGNSGAGARRRGQLNAVRSPIPVLAASVPTGTAGRIATRRARQRDD